MKKKIYVIAVLMMLLGLAACGSKKQEEKKEEGFKPALDTSVKAHIKVSGGYDNFEALEKEFDRFNEYYPGVELAYTKIDDYNNMIGTVLNGNDAPDIYVNNSWMYGREQYKDSIIYAEDLSASELGLEIDCIRSNILLKTDDATLPMVPVFSSTNGMLVNEDLFKKEGLSVPAPMKKWCRYAKPFAKRDMQILSWASVQRRKPRFSH